MSRGGRPTYTVPSSDSVLDDLVGISGAADPQDDRQNPPGPAPAPEVQATPTRTADTRAAKISAPKRTRTRPAAASAEDLPMPPPKKKAEVRQTFATKLPLEMIERVRRWAFAQDVEIQDLVELALDEFLTRRGG